MIKLKSLSKSESTHRKKFIQERHYNKKEQKRFDEAKAALDISYKNLYCDMRNGCVYAFMVEISLCRVGKVIASASVCANEAIDAFARVSNAISSFKAQEQTQDYTKKKDEHNI